MKKHSKNNGFKKAGAKLSLNLISFWSRVKSSPPLGGLTLNSRLIQGLKMVILAAILARFPHKPKCLICPGIWRLMQDNKTVMIVETSICESQ